MARHFPPIGYTFRDERLLQAALTHRSCVCECYVRDGGEEHDNQRLEFLGDAVLELFISEFLFSLSPRLSEGAMSRVRACFVCEGKLAEIARGIGLGEHLVISQPEDNSGGRDKASLLADAMEALLGAVFLDGGPEETRRIVLRLWSPYISGCSESPPAIADYKTALQEFTQRKGLGLPVYTLANTVGPAHQPTFFISVKVGDQNPATAMAHSKKEAAQNAAKILLQDLMDEEAASDAASAASGYSAQAASGPVAQAEPGNAAPMASSVPDAEAAGAAAAAPEACGSRPQTHDGPARARDDVAVPRDCRRRRREALDAAEPDPGTQAPSTQGNAPGESTGPGERASAPRGAKGCRATKGS
ncbi:MAG: ribonuclease III [Deltaproteobacteria bacterium]|jgi:ribonuclease-3|nr:ribonuclease III [Deltaproteobacteria bacterium]